MRARAGREAETLRCDDVLMDIAAHRVKRNGRDIHLGPTEFRLLRYLLEHPGRVFSREQLLDAVWAPTSMSSRARSTCTSAGCAAPQRRRRARSDPHRALGRLRPRPAGQRLSRALGAALLGLVLLLLALLGFLVAAALVALAMLLGA